MLGKVLRHSILPTVCVLGTMAVFSPQANANQTQAQCTPVPYSDGEFETVIQRGQNRATLIRWTPAGSAYFGDGYTPERRCQVVTMRLNQAIARNDGGLNNVLLTEGWVNNIPVICALNAYETCCTFENILFTLNREPADRIGQILDQILEVETAFYSGREMMILDARPPVYVHLGDWAEQALVDSREPAPESTVAPEPSHHENPVVQPDDSGGSMF